MGVMNCIVSSSRTVYTMPPQLCSLARKYNDNNNDNNNDNSNNTNTTNNNNKNNNDNDNDNDNNNDNNNNNNVMIARCMISALDSLMCVCVPGS